MAKESELGITLRAKESISRIVKKVGGRFKSLGKRLDAISAKARSMNQAFKDGMKSVAGMAGKAALGIGALGFGASEVLGRLAEHSNDLGREWERLGGIGGKLAGMLGDKLAPYVGLAADAMEGLTEKAAGAGDSFLGQFGAKMSQAADNALEWGVDIVAELASGMVQGAASALSWAMDMIGNLLSSWLSPGSPPKVAPKLDKWGASAMTEFLKGFGDAEFGVLESLQGPLRSALDTLADLGQTAAEKVGPAFAQLSGEITSSLAEFQKSGKMPLDLFDKLKKAGGQFGEQLAELARKEFGVARAVRDVEAAQRKLDQARAGEDKARDKIKKLRAEYKALLKAGADPALVKAKFAEIKAAQGGLREAKKSTKAAEEEKKAAEERLKPLQKQLQLQQKVVNQLLEVARAQVKADKAAGGLGAISMPELSGFTPPTKAFEKAKERIREKLADLFSPLRRRWENEMKPAIEGLGKKWEDFSTLVKQAYDEKIAPVVQDLKALIPDDLVKNIGVVSGVVLTAGGAFGALKLATSPVVAGIGALTKAISGVIGVVSAIVGVLGGPLTLAILAIGAVVAGLYLAWENNWFGIRDKLTEIWESFIKPTFETLVAWLEANIPIAIETLKTFWEDTLKPAIETVWRFIQDNVFPLFETLVAWLATNIPAAIETLKAFWEETLKPAIEAVWAFIQDYLIPLFESLVNLFDAVLGVSIEALTGLWQNVLLPAITAVHDFIRDFLTPIIDDVKLGLEALGTFIRDTLGPILDAFKMYTIDALKKSFDSVKNAIKGATDFINTLADKIRNFQLPDWLTPGSPTPFELGLRGIEKQMGRLARMQMPKVFSGVGLSPSMAVAGGGGGTYATGAGGNINLTINLSGGASREDAMRVADAIERKLRQRGVRRNF